MSVWAEEPLINKVYEALKELTKGGKGPVTENEIISYLTRNGYSISLPDLVKVLMKLEIMGLAYVASSSKEDRIIKLVASNQEANEA
ncbi:MAG: hypothetical protein ACP5HK_02610 [Acidilobus sp.]